FVDAFLSDVADNSHDDRGSFVIEQLDLPAESVTRTPKLLRKSMVDYDNTRSIDAVALADGASFENRNAHGLEIAGPDEVMLRQRLLAGNGSCSIKQRDGLQADVAAKRDANGHCGGAHAFNHSLVKIPLIRRAGVLRFRKTVFQGQKILEIE